MNENDAVPDSALGPGGAGQTTARLRAGSDADDAVSIAHGSAIGGSGTDAESAAAAGTTTESENLTAGEGLGSLNDASRDPLTRDDSGGPWDSGRTGEPDPEALGE